ncbi:MAG: NAD(P)H-binding protein [Ignavibacteriales bacterium]|nr:NAD(P)H-binding protein [Ignavibacteriales bacterium]
MKVLILGASGATGRLVLKQLLDQGIETKIVIRALSGISESHQNKRLLESIVGNISEFGTDEFTKLVVDCDVVISCLGHNISFKGMFGEPKNLSQTA